MSAVRWIAAACVGVAGIGSSFVARAQGTPSATPVVFESVDAYRVANSLLVITGVQKGASAPSTVKSYVNSTEQAASCERMLIQSINRPGRFYVTIESGECTLERR